VVSNIQEASHSFGKVSLNFFNFQLVQQRCSRYYLYNYKQLKLQEFHRPSLSYKRTRGNSCKLKKNHILNIRDASMFHNRVINFWNKLPDSVVLAASISSLKRRLSSFVVNVGFEHFSVN